jgi:two-component system chemotaxis response regulator CheY
VSYLANKKPVAETPLEKLKKVNVLVMDGGAKAATLIKSIFTTLGLENVFIATDGFQGVQIMKEVRIHLVFTDWELKTKTVPANGEEVTFQPVSGTKFVERIRKSSYSPNPFIPIVMMMDMASGSDVLSARDSGVNEILLRPINAENFCDRLVSIIDHPRMFVTAKTYKGPCRRRKQKPLPANSHERRKKEIRVVKSLSA